MKIATIIVLVTLLVPQSASAHCFSRWYYPYPQHCGGSYARHQGRIPVHRLHSDFVANAVDRRDHDVAVDFVLPTLINTVWSIPLATREQLELYDDLRRKRAIMQMPSGE